MNVQQPPNQRQQKQSPGKPRRKPTRFISLRVKLLLGFSLVFILVFAGTFYWFYTFTTEKAIARLKSDMRATLIGAANGVNVEELMALYAEGEPNQAGFSDDPRYQRQLAWLATVHSIEPRAWLYSCKIGRPNENRRVGKPAVKPGQIEMIYLVDLWAKYNPAKSVRFLESDLASSTVRQVVEQKKLIEESETYTDKWGTWLSAWAPLKNNQGEVVAVLGLDIEADYVLQVQQEIRDKILISFTLTYGILLILIYVLSSILTKQLIQLTQASERIAAGDYDQNLSALSRGIFPNEMNILARVFEGMIHSIRIREQLIRESQQAEDEMRHALQEEKELNELKSRFVSMVSHELRTPLTIIRTSIALLEDFGDSSTEEEKQEYFDRIRVAIKTMTQLMEDVLTLSKAEAGKLECKPSRLNVEEFCREIVKEMRLGYGTAHTIAFIAQTEDQELYLDHKLLRSILTNLLSNAIKYSPAGSTVEFTLSCSKQVAIFEIQDHGIGIPQEDQPRLFESFHRARNVSVVRGTGLGLAIVKQCIIRHRGQITFTSQEGIGTTFRVVLPDLPDRA